MNPLRQDTNAGSCYLSEYEGKIVLTDWASYKYSGRDCIAAYMELNPFKAWSEVIYELLQVGSYSNYVPAVVKRKKTLDLKPIYKEWTPEEEQWWLKQGITREQMDRPETLVRPVKGYIHTKEGKEMKVYLSEPAYCYHCGGKYKFYFPTRKEGRFLGNQNRDCVWEIDRGSKTLLVAKCQKDMLTLENLVPFNLTHVQGENYGHPGDMTIYEWEVKYDKIILFFDGDESGISGMKRLQQRFLYTPCECVWITEQGIKDTSQMHRDWGKEDTIDYLIELLK